LDSIFVIVAAGLMGIGLLLSFVRLVAGPRAGDRTVALDTATLITTNIVVLIAFLSGRAIYIDVAIVDALLSFLGVLAVARYLDGGMD